MADHEEDRGREARDVEALLTLQLAPLEQRVLDAPPDLEFLPQGLHHAAVGSLPEDAGPSDVQRAAEHAALAQHRHRFVHGRARLLDHDGVPRQVLAHVQVGFALVGRGERLSPRVRQVASDQHSGRARIVGGGQDVESRRGYDQRRDHDEARHGREAQAVAPPRDPPGHQRHRRDPGQIEEPLAGAARQHDHQRDQGHDGGGRGGESARALAPPRVPGGRRRHDPPGSDREHQGPEVAQVESEPRARGGPRHAGGACVDNRRSEGESEPESQPQRAPCT